MTAMTSAPVRVKRTGAQSSAVPEVCSHRAAAVDQGVELRAVVVACSAALS
ncbi:MAG: hypothetical protein ACK4UY_05370 [Dietzia sp.]